MILTCPSCGTRYVVKDGAIPPEGRTVRCAQCKHSWHQEAEEPSAAGDERAAMPGERAAETPAEPVQHIPEDHRDGLGEQPVAPPEEEAAPASDAWDAPAPEAPAEEALMPTEIPAAPMGEGAPAASSPGFSDFPADPESDAATMPAEAAAAADPYPTDAVPAEAPVEEPRASHPLRAARAESDELYSPYAAADEGEAPRRRWPLILLGVLVLVAVVAVAIWFLAPNELKNRLGLAQASGASLLLVQVQNPRLRPLESGNSLLEVSGTISNPTEETIDVPAMNGQLRSLEQKVVYEWTIAPPTPRLAPGGSASFSSANLNVPVNETVCLEVTFDGHPREPAQCRETAAVAS